MGARKIYLTGGVLALLLWAAPARAHGIETMVENIPPVRVTFTYRGGGPVAGCDYEIFDPDMGSPVSTGRTDSLGRMEFLPDRVGRWQVRVWSEDGHGGTAQVMVDDQMIAAVTPAGSSGRAGRILAGVVVIFAVFGVLYLFTRKKRAHAHS